MINDLCWEFCSFLKTKSASKSSFGRLLSRMLYSNIVYAGGGGGMNLCELIL